MENFEDQNMTNTPQDPLVPDAPDVSAATDIPAVPAAPEMSGIADQSMTAPGGAVTGQGVTSGPMGAQDQGTAPVKPLFSNDTGDRSEYMQPVFMPTPPAEEPPKKKIKIWPLVVALVVLLLIAGGLITFLMRDVIANNIAKSSKTPEEYLKYVVDKQPWDKAFDGYEAAFEQMNELGDMKTEGEIRLQMSEDMLEVAEDGITEAIKSARRYSYYWDDDELDDIRLDAWRDIALKFEFQQGDGGLSAMQAVQLKDKEPILTIEEMYDTAKSTAYLRMPQVNEDYASVKLSNFLKDDELDMVNQLLGGGNKTLNSLPSPKVMKSMYHRYIDAMLDQIEDVDMSNDTFTVNGESIKCTVLSFTMDEELQKAITLALIDEIRNDDDLEDMFYNFVKEASMGQDVDPDEMWDEMIESLENAEQKLDDFEADAEPDLYIYVDNKGNIIGISAVESKDELLAGYIRKGTKVWFEFSGTSGKKDLFAFTGTGKAGVSGISMEGTIMINDDEEIEVPFSVENISDKGGTFRMDMEPVCDFIRDKANDDVADDIMDILEGDLVISTQRNDLDVKNEMYIEKKGDRQIGISYNIKLSKAGDIEFPTNKQSVKINSTMEILPYLGDCDLNKLVDALETLGLPDESAEEMRSTFDMLDMY